MGEGLVGVVRRAYDAFARRDADALVEFADPDIELHLITGPLTAQGGPYRGLEGIRRYLADVDSVWDEITLQPRQYVEIEDDQVLVLGRVRTRKGTTHMDMPNAWLWEAANGKVTSVRLLVDAESISALLRSR
jgi:ketosteroid isomerase-like protein